MPKEHFKINEARALSDLKPGAKIHVIGVCGVAMAQLSIALANQGFNVSGSDKEFYEPMGSLLRKSPVRICEGYKAENVPADVDLVVIGNAVSYGHPEVSVVEERNLPYTLFPKLLAETVIGNRHSIAVCGTHGKSTTTAIVASILFKLGLEPSYFVGGIAQDLPESLRVGTGGYSVVEGDEYDSAFFAKVPKFSFYKPQTCIINAIEFDHADIYPDISAINREFTGLVNSLSAEALAICCIDFFNLKEQLIGWKQSARCRFATFGVAEDADYRILDRRYEGMTQLVRYRDADGRESEFAIPMVGEYNARNALAAIIATRNLKLDQERVLQALSTFSKVKRRQEVRFDSKEVVLIEDFAHHPTAVKETLAAIREVYPKKKLWAVYEPRSNTSRRSVFQDDYIHAFSPADQVLLAEVQARSIDSGSELLDVASLSEKIKASGVSSLSLSGPEKILEHILENKGRDDVIVVMSNGSFGGLIQKLEDSLRK